MSTFTSNDGTPSMDAIQSISVESLTPITSTNNDTDKNNSLKIKSLTSVVSSEGKTPSSWDSKDDILLRHLKEIKKLGWKEIAQYFSNRTPNACQFRWRRLRSGSLKHKSIAQNMELENVKIQGELNVPTKHVPSNSMATVSKMIASTHENRRGSNSSLTTSNNNNINSNNDSNSSFNGISQPSNFVTKKKPRSRSIPTSSISPNLRQQSSGKQQLHYANMNQTYDSYTQMTPPSHNYSMPSNSNNNNNNNNNSTSSRYRKNSLTTTPPSNGSLSSPKSLSTVYPIVNDEQIGYIPKIKIRSRRNSTVSLSTRQQPSTNMNSMSSNSASSCFLDNPQSDFRNRSRSNSASNTVISMERRLSVLMGSTNLQFNQVSGGASNGGSAHGSRRGSGMVYYNPNSIYNNSNSSFVSGNNSNNVSHSNHPAGVSKRDEDVAIEDD